MDGRMGWNGKFGYDRSALDGLNKLYDTTGSQNLYEYALSQTLNLSASDW